MAQIIVNTSRFSTLADLASAYTLAFVLKLNFPFLSFTSLPIDPATTDAIDIILIGGIISSLLFFVDPVNKLVRIFLNKLLTRKEALKRLWGIGLIDRLLQITNIQDPTLRRNYFIVKARASYYTPYLAKLRAQITGGLTFSASILLLIPVAKPPIVGIALAILGIVTLINTIRDILVKVPLQSWIVTVYQCAVEFKPRSNFPGLDRITRLLSNGNWEEAQNWLTYEITQPSQPPIGVTQP